MDHRPLEGLEKKMATELQNTRVANCKGKLKGLSYEVHYLEGKSNTVADDLSCTTVWKSQAKEVSCHSITVSFTSKGEFKSGDPMLETKRKEAGDNEDCMKIIKAFKENKQVKKLDSQHPACSLASEWDKLSLDSEEVTLIIMERRLLVPKASRKEILKAAHLFHEGPDKSYFNLRSRYMWKQMMKDIKKVCEQCSPCMDMVLSRQKEELSQPYTETKNLKLM